VTDHLFRLQNGKVSADPGAAPTVIPTVIPACSGADYYQDSDGRYWRMFEFLVGAKALEECGPPNQVAMAGRAYGCFLRWMSTYDGPELQVTIPHFHDTHWRYAELERVVTLDPVERITAAKDDVARARDYSHLADGLVSLQRSGVVPSRIVHNDAKPSNVLTIGSDWARFGVIDLDTVMPGLVLYDFGDLVRATVSGCGEDERDLAKIMVHEAFFRLAANGYLAEVGAILTPAEREHLVVAALVITFEQGLRFLTDYLAGDVYYKTVYPEHNLDRCRNQFKLLAELITAQEKLERIIAELCA
jgi:Ser/Thr protein kinase RdoA (MazF antagonist)